MFCFQSTTFGSCNTSILYIAKFSYTMQSFLKKSYILLLLFFIAVVTFAQDAETGIAAYYSDEFNGGSTASGEPYDKTKLTAAHNSIPFGSIVKVTNLTNGKSVRVRVNDRGPYIKGRIIDVSSRAAKVLGMVNTGEARVKLELSNEDDAAITDAKDEIPKEYNNNEVLSARGNTPSYIEDAPKKAIKAAPKPASVAVVTIKKKAVKIKNEPTEWNEPNDITIETDVSSYFNNRMVPVKEYSTNTLLAKGTSAKNYGTAVLVKGKDFKPYDLYQIKLLRPEKKGFGVQIASLDTYEAAMKEIANLQGLLYNNVLMSIEKGKDGATNYKVIIGPYTDKKNAEATKTALVKKIKAKGFIVDLASR
jgi:rare lipoprotein A